MIFEWYLNFSSQFVSQWMKSYKRVLYVYDWTDKPPKYILIVPFNGKYEKLLSY